MDNDVYLSSASDTRHAAHRSSPLEKRVSIILYSPKDHRGIPGLAEHKFSISWITIVEAFPNDLSRRRQLILAWFLYETDVHRQKESLTSPRAALFRQKIDKTRVVAECTRDSVVFP